jgi:hypothetical protein
MSSDNGSTAQSNRIAKESYAQKVYEEFVNHLKNLDAGFFTTDEE